MKFFFHLIALLLAGTVLAPASTSKASPLSRTSFAPVPVSVSLANADTVAVVAPVEPIVPIAPVAAVPHAMDRDVTPVLFDSGLFRPSPSYELQPYGAIDQLEIYGGKRHVSEPFYPLLFGSRMYGTGEIREGINLVGSKNLLSPRLMAFGDWRTAYALNNDGTAEKGELNTRLNLDLDLRLTATERVHAFTRPFDKNGQFTGLTFNDQSGTRSRLEADFNLDALFFEGDLGNMLAGVTNSYNKLDMPIAAGLMPFVLHNGTWVNDIFTGVAVTLPARNSPTFDISNMDLTLFTGFDNVTTAVQKAANGDQARIFGMNLFADWRGHYIELGYGFTQDLSANKSDYHSVVISNTHRYRNIVSLSERAIFNFGQHPGVLDRKKTADGYLLLLEASWMTRKPYTLIPYTNFFFGHGTPQALASQAPLLQNTGITFEPDGMTTFQTLENSGNETFGGAIGLEYLFNLDHQIVLEFSTVQIQGRRFDANRKAAVNEYGFGLRYQRPLTKWLVWRSDGIYDARDGLQDKYGVRTELRIKF